METISNVNSIAIAAGCMAFNPLFWNIVARNEYRNRTISNILGSKLGNYLLAATIFSLGLFRDSLFYDAVSLNGKSRFLSGFTFLPFVGECVSLIGLLFVGSSMYKLGIHGTYLGDYFGIFMKERVTSFPFNVLENPMYVGSVLIHLGYSLRTSSLVGLGLTLWIHLMYQVALRFEGPFTDYIFAQKANSKKPIKKSNKSN